MSRWKKNCPETSGKGKNGFFSQKITVKDQPDEKSEGKLDEKLDQVCSYAREIRDEIKGVRDQVGKNTDAIAANRKDIEAIKAFVGMPGSVQPQPVPTQAQTQTPTQSQQAPTRTSAQDQNQTPTQSQQAQQRTQTQPVSTGSSPLLSEVHPSNCEGVYYVGKGDWLTVKAVKIRGAWVIAEQ